MGAALTMQARGVPQTLVEIPLRQGNAGLGDTLRHIRRLIDEGSKSPAVRWDAARMVRYAGPRDRDVIEAIFDGVLGIDQPVYRYDPIHVELLRTADSTSTQIDGIDCDDYVIRAGARLGAMGIPTRPEVWGKTSKQFSHVYLEAYDRQRRTWIPFDPVMRRVKKDARVGDRPPGGVRGTMMNTTLVQGALQQPRTQLGDVGSFFDTLKSIGRAIDPTIQGSLARSIISSVPIGSNLVAAADTVASARKTIQKVTGVDIAKVAGAATAKAPAKAAPAPAAKAIAAALSTAKAPAAAVTQTSQIAAALKAAPALKLTPQAPTLVATQTAQIAAALKPGPVQTSAPTAPAKKSNALLYAGAGAGALAIGWGLSKVLGKGGRR